MAGTVHHGHAVGGRAEAAVAVVDAVARQQIGILAGTLAAGQLQQAVHVGRGLGRKAQHFLPFPPLVRQGPQYIGIGREADAETVLLPFFLELLRAQRFRRKVRHSGTEQAQAPARAKYKRKEIFMTSAVSAIDWNATAAWAALAISIVGSIISPIITTILTNRYQLKLRQMDIHTNTISAYEKNRFETLNTFIAKSGKCLAYFDETSVSELGEFYFQIYQYVPIELWNTLDEFYECLINFDRKNACKMHPLIIHRLAEILKV